jgi:hypothetical protein
MQKKNLAARTRTMLVMPVFTASLKRVDAGRLRAVVKASHRFAPRSMRQFVAVTTRLMETSAKQQGEEFQF